MKARFPLWEEQLSLKCPLEQPSGRSAALEAAEHAVGSGLSLSKPRMVLMG